MNIRNKIRRKNKIASSFADLKIFCSDMRESILKQVTCKSCNQMHSFANTNTQRLKLWLNFFSVLLLYKCSPCWYLKMLQLRSFDFCDWEWFRYGKSYGFIYSEFGLDSEESKPIQTFWSISTFHTYYSVIVCIRLHSIYQHYLFVCIFSHLLNW